ncbi:hypothetical protein ACWEQL_40020 [Kitasatospora sp. NPDC004240]
MSEPQQSRLLADDMQLRRVEGGPVSYNPRTTHAVEYVAIANTTDGVIGYLWACDADDAAGWEGRRAVGPISMNGGKYWVMKLREAKARGIPPSAALAEFASDTGGGWSGQVVPGSRAQAASVAELQAVAHEGWEPPAPPANTRRPVR